MAKRRHRKLKPGFIVVSLILIVAIIVVTAVSCKGNDRKKTDSGLVLGKTGQFEINTEVYASELIEESSRKKITSEDYLLDLSTLGKHTAVFSVGEETVSVSYTCVDTTPPVISLKTDAFTVPKGSKVDFGSYIENITDNSGEELQPEITSSYDENTGGTYPVTYTVTDGSGNKATAVLNITVDTAIYYKVANGVYSLIDGTYPTKNGKVVVIKNGIAYVKESASSDKSYMIANKCYSLPKSYAPGFVKEASDAYEAMFAAAAKEGIDLPKRTAYRSYSFQNSLYTNYVKSDGKQKADTYSARPGFSEHQTGYCLDMVSVTSSKNAEFKKEYDWLSANASKFGYILRYPEGKTDITGYIYEPWHYRYVGTELAEKLYNGGDWITMEEYFGIESHYNY